jgi:hypothetical protein
MPETLQERYDKRTADWITHHCFFCEEKLPMVGGFYKQEVGEFWSEELGNSVLGHPDCTPNGIDAIFNGEDPDWKMA